ncbi:sensor histidine kinase YesM [Aequitasia blattaphilus]|uniref:histidine kinase n=1 Tax=Aequitasia blattaphilus TaxID=2949332 RepID=A0ABT1EB07_9FIRM|nr:histidine kinase [Aequitasia blattaphilus]MCP1103025.1 histidine kinase [Aequitasia blattaphilus]MCR8615665.1 histidine kinase [Aequitasia blattaphilus]
MRIVTKKQLEKLIEKRISEERKKNQSLYRKQILDYSRDLMALQSQINPHFLYNSLECIRGLAMIEGSNEIARISENLSNFFRYNINIKRDIVTIHDEVENVKNYITIQQFRFQDKFQIHYDFENNSHLLAHSLPKLTLQPLVENALNHGLKDTLTDGLITITLEEGDSFLLIHIIDNGKGIEPPRLIEIQNALYDAELQQLSSDRSNNGSALLNVHHRLQLHFGFEFGLEIKSALGFGTRITIRLPRKDKNPIHYE